MFRTAPALLVFLLCASCAAPARPLVVGLYKDDELNKLPNGGRPLAEAQFPEIRDPSTLRFKLSRELCFGECPEYSVEIRSDGSVLYDGEGFVAVSGHHRAKISEPAVKQLLAAFRDAKFFWLFDDYDFGGKDAPIYEVSLSFDGRTKTVRDVMGRSLGMPKEVAALEDEIDAVSGSERWIKGNAQTMAALKAEGWDFRAMDEEHQKSVVEAAMSASPELFNEMLDGGARAIGRDGCEALSWSADKLNRHAVDALLRTGAPPHWDAPPGTWRFDTCDALSGAVEQADPEIVLDLLEAGADPYAHNGNDQTPFEIAMKSGDGKMAGVMRRWMEAHPKPR
jgi:hypothetical protein